MRVDELRIGVDDVHIVARILLDPVADMIAVKQALRPEADRNSAEDIRCQMLTPLVKLAKYLEFAKFGVRIVTKIKRLET